MFARPLVVVRAGRCAAWRRAVAVARNHWRERRPSGRLAGLLLQIPLRSRTSLRRPCPRSFEYGGDPLRKPAFLFADSLRDSPNARERHFANRFPLSILPIAGLSSGGW